MRDGPRGGNGGAGFNADCSRMMNVGVDNGAFFPVWINRRIGPHEFELYAGVAILNDVYATALGLTVDPTDEDVFYLAGFSAGALRPSIAKMNFHNNAELLDIIFLDHLGIDLPGGLDMDPVTGDFFVTDQRGHPAIYRVTSTGDLVERIDLEPMGIRNPAAVAYNPNNGHLFVSDGSRENFPLVAELAPGPNAARHWRDYR